MKLTNLIPQLLGCKKILTAQAADNGVPATANAGLTVPWLATSLGIFAIIRNLAGGEADLVVWGKRKVDSTWEIVENGTIADVQTLDGAKVFRCFGDFYKYSRVYIEVDNFVAVGDIDAWIFPGLPFLFLAQLGVDISNISSLFSDALVADGDPQPPLGMQIAGKADDGNSYYVLVDTDGRLQTAGAADFTAVVGDPANTTVAQTGLVDVATGDAMAAGGDANTSGAYAQRPIPDDAVEITPTTAAAPVAAEMEPLALTDEDVAVSFYLSTADGNTDCRLRFYVRARETGVIFMYPGADFTSLETAGNERGEFFLEPRPSGMVYDLIGAYFTSTGAGTPVYETHFRVRK